MPDTDDGKRFADILTFLTSAVFAAGLLRVLFGMNPASWGAAHFGIAAICAAGMILVPIRGRLREFSFNKEGVTAKLDAEKQDVLQEVAREAGDDVAERVRPKLEAAGSKEAVEAIRSVALEAGKVKVNAFEKLADLVGAIQNRKKIRVTYTPRDGIPTELDVCPLDIQAGRTGATAGNDYVWVYSPKDERPLSLRLDRLGKVDVLPETFDPSQLKLAEARVPPQIVRE